jgi:SPOR domain
MEASPSAALAAALVSASATPPVTRSIALQASAAEPAQAPAPIAAAPPAPTPTPAPAPNRPKAASVGADTSSLPNGDATPTRAKNPAPRASAAPADIAPAPLKPPAPAPRPSASASAAGAPKPAPMKEKLDPPAALHADAGRDQAVARSDAPAPAAPPTAPAAAEPGNGGGTTDSVLGFVPNLYQKAAHALGGSPATTQVATADAAPPPPPSAPAAPSGGGFSADSVLQFVPNLYDKAASALRGSPPPTQVARADPKPAATGDRGDYGVQFAAPASEPAARKESARLRSKFASELGGLQPSVRQAEAHGHKIYQVRIGGLSKADAAALCLKLKSSGEAACSVARD